MDEGEKGEERRRKGKTRLSGERGRQTENIYFCSENVVDQRKYCRALMSITEVFEEAAWI